MPELKGASLPCPIPGCLNLRKPEHCMCWGHWRRVPKAMQAAIWQSVGHPEIWRRAMFQATVAVVSKENKKMKPGPDVAQLVNVFEKGAQP